MQGIKYQQPVNTSLGYRKNKELQPCSHGQILQHSAGRYQSTLSLKLDVKRAFLASWVYT